MYYYTDKEELEALKKENIKLKADNANLINALGSSINECGEANRTLIKLKAVVLDHIVYDKEGKAKYISAVKPILDLLEDKHNVKSGE